MSPGMRSVSLSLWLVTVLGLGGLLLAPVSSSVAANALGARASVSLVKSSVTLTQTSDTAWTLSKSGTQNTTNSTVTWTVTATEGATTHGQLVLNGTMTVENNGLAGATIGNIVANLQTKSGSQWVSRSSDIADATTGDAATTAHIVAAASSEGHATFTENAASGPLQFTDAHTNTLFSLVPEVTLPPGGTLTLLFSASFDNTVLHLVDGTPARAEIIVSFGNAAPGSMTAPNIDINGNGTIDANEVRVRSVPERAKLSVPAEVPGNAVVTLSDTLDDITTTGTVTFSNPVFNLGAPAAPSS